MVPRRIDQPKFPQSHRNVRRRPIRSPVQEGNGIRKVVLVKRRNRPGPNLDSSVLKRIIDQSFRVKKKNERP